MNPILLILALTVTKPADAVIRTIEMPGPQGLIVCQWTPRLTAPPIFNHFIDQPRQIHLGMHYDTYIAPVIRLVVGAVHVCRSRPVVIVKDRPHLIVAFWRHVGPMFEAGVYLNGKLVGHLWEPARPYKTWTSPAWVGMRFGGEPVSDPTFPGKAHADGTISIAIYR